MRFGPASSKSVNADLPDRRLGAPESLAALLQNTVGNVFGVQCDLLWMPTRGRAPVALARQVAMYLAHVGCGLTLTQSGALFERDRSTVAHACRVVERRRDEPSFDRAIELLEQVVRILSWPREPASPCP